MYPKILVGCPTYDGKSYCLDKYIKAVTELSYPNYDILLVDNSKTDDYFNKIKDSNIPVIKDQPEEKPHDAIVKSRNIIKKHFLEKNYDYFLSLEQDVIPDKDIIEKLLVHNKKVISGVYHTIYRFHGIPKLRPLIWADVPNQPDKMRFMNPECLKAKDSQEPVLKKIKMCGLGCLLIHRSILEKIDFRVPKDYSTYDDFAFCNDVRDLKEDIWADLSIQCDHIIEKIK
jgi:GT2 family glycosyltransferase